MEGKKKYTFVEKGVFVPLLGVIGVVVGIAIASNGFSDLAVMNDGQAAKTVGFALAGAVLGVLAAIGIRRVV